MKQSISIIVPVYNAETFIEQTVLSVIGQTFKDWELLLVDDLSTDGSRSVIKRMCEKDSRIRLIEKEKNEGAAMARNTGLNYATSRYIAFLDADDLWLPDKLSQELSYLKKKQAGFVFTAYEFGDVHGVGTGKIVSVPEALTYRQALSRTVIFTSTVLADTTKIDKSLLHMPNVGSEDTATWWNILRHGHTAYGLNRVLVIYRRPGKSLSSNKKVAIKRIWNLYRRQEGLSFWYSACCFVFWAIRAVIRRI